MIKQCKGNYFVIFYKFLSIFLCVAVHAREEIVDTDAHDVLGLVRMFSLTTVADISVVIVETAEDILLIFYLC